MDGMDRSFQEFFSQQHSQFSPPSGQAKQRLKEGKGSTVRRYFTMWIPKLQVNQSFPETRVGSLAVLACLNSTATSYDHIQAMLGLHSLPAILKRKLQLKALVTTLQP